MDIDCINHEGVPATHAVLLPSHEKINGEYKELVAMCAPCSERMKHIGFKPTLIVEE
jgi:hypothetical protein